MRADDDRCLRPDERGGVQALVRLRKRLAADRVGEACAKTCAGDLQPPRGLQPGPGLAHGGRHRAFSRRDLGLHHGDDVGIDVELQFHAGLRSTVQTSRSRSRTGSP